ncbi:MAG: 2OG-Fe(II) oxygenase [Alphaproteobacteria bacterium]|nr:2OG-Fe(II) oxygenase [Alphaproteobacteria bacterium]
MEFVDLTAFDEAPLNREPFKFTVVQNFLKPDQVDPVLSDFPDIPDPGIFPMSALQCGASFSRLVDEIQSPAITAAFSEKFEVDLSQYPLMVTVRGQCQKKDGRIHTDTPSKIVTALLYLNRDWTVDGGRIRFLGSKNLDDSLGEVAPIAGNLISFQRNPVSWHGHKPFVGRRQYIMFNWMRDSGAANRQISRHGFTARAKRLARGFA